MFSDYPEEKEIMLAPGSKFKVLNIDDVYYATKSHNCLCRKVYIGYVETDIFKIDLKPTPFYHTLIFEDELDFLEKLDFITMDILQNMIEEA